MRRPKRLFRCHRRGETPHVDHDVQTAVEAFLAAHRGRFRPGTVTQVTVLHDPDCRYPQGGPCRCDRGPEIRLADDQPESN